MAVSMGDLAKRLEQLEKDHQQLLEMFIAHKAGVTASFATLSAVLREIPEFDATMIRRLLTASLQTWPIQGIPDNEVTETLYAAPLRMLIGEHESIRKETRSGKPEAD